MVFSRESAVERFVAPLIALLGFLGPAEVVGQAEKSAFRLACGEQRIFRPSSGKEILLHVTDRKPCQSATDIQLQAPMEESVQWSDVLLVQFRYRSPSSRGPIEVAAGRQVGPYNTSARFEIIPRDTWQQLSFPFQARYDYGSKELYFKVYIGHLAGALEIRDFTFQNLRKTKDIRNLPRSEIRRDWKPAGSSWDQVVQRNIEKNRQGNWTVRVTDSRGGPVRNGEVHFKLKRHSFSFGTAIAEDTWFGDAQDSRVFRTKVLQLFNSVTPENFIKWHYWIHDSETPKKIVTSLFNEGLRVRGHTLFWPQPGLLPVVDQNPNIGSEALRKALASHSQVVLGSLGHQIKTWDVVNEPSPEDLLSRRLGSAWIAEISRGIQILDPGARLFINDNQTFEHRRDFSEHLSYLESLIQEASTKNVRLNLGLQGHTSWILPKLDVVKQIFDRLSKRSDLEITELEISIPHEDIQAEYMRDFLALCFSHPNMLGVTLWGFWEGHMADPLAALYRRNWEEKPVGRTWRKLLQETWSTDIRKRTDDQGKAQIHGFMGRYEIQVKSSGGVQTFELDLSKKFGTFHIQLL